MEQVYIDGKRTAIWTPTNALPPLVLFSHGYHGNNVQSEFLCEALEDAGYLVMAPNHDDAFLGIGNQIQLPFEDPDSWTPETYEDRGDDIKRLLVAVSDSPDYTFDHDRVVVVGHSLGGYTALGLGGAWPSWKMPGLKAIVALAPFCEPFVLNGDLAGIDAPVMYQTGNRDLAITTSIRRNGGAFDKTSAVAYYVEFSQANHFSFLDIKPDHHGIMAHYALSFLDYYVKGLPTTPWAKQSGVSEMRTKL